MHRIFISTLALVALVAAGLPDAARAQAATARLHGTVVDETTRAAITGATVTLVELRRSDVTHEDGGFDFARVAPARYTLRVTRIGFAPVSSVIVLAGADTSITITMRQAAVVLDATVTTGTITARSSQETLSPTSVVGGAELDRVIGGTLAASLQNVPGVSLASVGPATARPVIRGLSGDRVVVLEDGARTGDMSSTGADHAIAVDPLTIRQFEVVRGPMSLLYGSSALGGVVNAIREDVPVNRPEHLTGSVTAGATSVDHGTSLGTIVSAPWRGLAVRADASVRNTDDLHTPLGVLDNTSVRTLSGGAGVSRTGDRGYGGGAYRVFSNEYGVPGGFIGGHDEGVRIEMLRHQFKGEGEYRFTSGLVESMRSVMSYTNYQHLEREASGSVGTRFDQHVLATDLLARHGTSTTRHSGVVGARWQFRDIATGGTLRTPSTRDNALAAFIVEEWARDRLRLQGGARYDWAHYDPYQDNAGILVNGELIPTRPRTFANFSGSLGALYQLADAMRVGVSVSRAYRTPDFNELYSNGPHLAANSYDVGNPQLGQETGLGADAFVRWGSERVRAEAAVFRNRMRGYIYPRNTGDIGLQGNRPKFQFTGRDAVLWGGEGSLDLHLTRYLVAEATASSVRGEFIGAVDALPPDSANGIFQSRPGSRYLPLMPPLNGRAGLRYEDRRIFGGAGVRVAAAQDQLGDYETRTPGYATWDANIGLRLMRGGGFHAVTLRVDNALDRATRNHLARTKDIMPDPGRNVSLLYRISY
jgi:iron complex outermembrane recepter protein